MGTSDQSPGTNLPSKGFDKLQQAILSFIMTGTLDDAKCILERHPELLSAEAGDVFDKLIAIQNDPFASELFVARRELLRRCTIIGIDEAFASPTPTIVKHSSKEQRPIELDLRK